MPIRVKHDVHKVGVLERRRRTLVGLIGILPAGGPGFPELPDDVVAVGLKPSTPPVGVEIPLIPQPRLACR